MCLSALSVTRRCFDCSTSLTTTTPFFDDVHQLFTQGKHYTVCNVCLMWNHWPTPEYVGRSIMKRKFINSVCQYRKRILAYYITSIYLLRTQSTALFTTRVTFNVFEINTVREPIGVFSPGIICCVPVLQGATAMKASC
jgi:hypothetical protein